MPQKASFPQGTCMEGSVSAVGGSVPGCRGRSPRRNKLLGTPFPPGRGSGGWGKESTLKAGSAGDQKGKPPPCAPPTPQPPRAAGDKPPLGAWFAPLLRCPLRFSPGDARGEAPCIRKFKISPFPPGRGIGGMGARKQAKGRIGGQPKRHAPAGTGAARQLPCNHRDRKTRKARNRATVPIPDNQIIREKF